MYASKSLADSVWVSISLGNVAIVYGTVYPATGSSSKLWASGLVLDPTSIIVDMKVLVTSYPLFSRFCGCGFEFTALHIYVSLLFAVNKFV